MRTSRRGIAFIARFGYRARVHEDGNGRRQVGHGHKGRGAWRGARVSRRDARDLLRYDLMRLEPLLGVRIGSTIPSHRFDALMSLAHDLGMDALERTPLLDHVAAARVDAAAACIGSAVGGDLRRRQSERALFLSGAASPIAVRVISLGKFTRCLSLLLLAAGSAGVMPESGLVDTGIATVAVGAWLHLAASSGGSQMPVAPRAVTTIGIPVDSLAHSVSREPGHGAVRPRAGTGEYAAARRCATG